MPGRLLPTLREQKGAACIYSHRITNYFYCIDDFQASRAPDDRYPTTPLNGLWTHTKGGFYHDGCFPALIDVVDHYNSCKSLGLSAGDETDLVEYLKSLPDQGRERDNDGNRD